MKSGRQRRNEIQQQRAARRAGEKAAIETSRIQVRTQQIKDALRLAGVRPSAEGQVLVNPERLRPYGCFSKPEFEKRGFYMDLPFTCKDCGVMEVWTATQQKWWYETAKGDVATIASRCRPCRRRERDRKAAARRTHLEGLAKKRKV